MTAGGGGSAGRRIRRTAALYLTAFLLVIVTISMYINIASFKTQYMENELSFYAVSGSRLVDSIENGLLYGKSPDTYYGLDKLIRDWAGDDGNIRNVALLSPDGEELYYRMQEGGEAGNDEIRLEVCAPDGELVGRLELSIDLSGTMEQMDKTILSRVLWAGIPLLAGILAILIFCAKSGFLTEDLKINKKKLLVFMLLLILILQSVFTAYSFNMLRGLYVEVAENSGQAIEELVQADLDKVLEQGVTYDQIYQFEEYADEIVEKIPIVENIRLLYGSVSVTTKVNISREYVRQALEGMLVDMLTILTVSLFLGAEIVNYMIISVNRRTEKISGRRAYDKALSIRASSFLIHIACYLPISFVPAMMDKYTGGGAGDLLLGLPITVLFASCLVFTFLAGNWSLRWGWKRLLLIGIALLAGSSLLAAFVANAVVLVIARGIYGAAYALIYVSIREFAATGDRQTRSKGLAQVTAGLYAGINIGAVLGSLLVSSVGYMGVFLISAAIAALSIVVARRHCIPDEEAALPEEAREEEAAAVVAAPVLPAHPEAETQAEKKAGFLTVLRDPAMLRLLLLIVAPLAIADLFFEYFLPVYALKGGISSADVGRAFLVNGLAIAYGAPLLVKYCGKRLNERTSLLLFTLLMAVGFLIFGVWGSALAILIAAGVMGLGEGTAFVSQNMVMLDLEVAKKAGASRMLSVYASARKLAQTAGPQIFAAFMIVGYQTGMLLFGGCMALCSIIYFIEKFRKAR